MDSLTPEQSVRENELICKKLLGWIPHPREVAGLVHIAYWNHPSEDCALPTPSFTTWAEAGLILERLYQRWQYPVVHAIAGETWRCELVTNGMSAKANTGPLAIRAAALEYIKAVKS